MSADIRNKTEMAQRIEGFHAAYVQITGQQVRLDMQREGVWYEFFRREFTVEDLRLVVRQIRRGIANGKRNVGALKFSNLIGQLDYFEEDLAQARAEARARAERGDPARADVLRESGRGAAEARPGARERTAGQVLAGVKQGDSEAARKALEEFRALKNKL